MTDLDIGSNAELDFSLEASLGQTHFSLTSNGRVAQLHLARALDREFIDSYTLRIFATDRGSPPLIGEIAIWINVTVRDQKNNASRK